MAEARTLGAAASALSALRSARGSPQALARHGLGERRAQMVQALARDWVYEAMTIDRAAARIGVRQHSQALEAKLRPAATAHHLVALSVLGILAFQMFFCHCDLTLGALLRSRFDHPPA